MSSLPSNSFSRGGLIVAACFLALAAEVSSGQPVQVGAANQTADGDISLSIGGTWSDNIRQSETMEESGSYTLLGIVSEWDRQSPRLDLALDADLEYRDYSVEDFDSELYGFADFSLEAHAVPERFSWLVGNRIGQARPDAFEIDRPDNRSTVSVFSTGPRLILPMGERTTLRIDVEEIRRRVQDEELFDSDDLATSIAVARALNRTTDVGLHIENHDIDYFNAGFAKEITATYLSYDRQLTDGSVSLALGDSSVDFLQEDNSTTYVDAQWTQGVGARSVISLTLGQQFIDMLQDFEYYDPGDLLLSADVYERQGFSLDFSADFGRTDLQLVGSVAKSDYLIDTSLDNDETLLRIDLSRSVSERMEVGIGADYSDRKFIEDGRTDRTDTLRLSLHRAFSGPFSLRVLLEEIERSGLQLRTVDEKRLTVYLQYDLRR